MKSKRTSFFSVLKLRNGFRLKGQERDIMYLYLSVFLDKMFSRLETLPNEVLLLILCYLPYLEMMTSIWPLNKRFKSLIYLTLSTNENQYNSGLILAQPGLSFSKWYSILFPLICHLSSPRFGAYIKCIHFDGTNSSVCDLSYEWLFQDNINNDEKVLRYPNLKSLALTRCLLIEPLLKTLPLLINNQLDVLTLSFDKELLDIAREKQELDGSIFSEGNDHSFN